jgi:hypothetical protein
LVESNQIHDPLAPIQRLSPCVSWPDRPLERHDSVVQLEERRTFLAGPYPEVRYVPGIIAALLEAVDDAVLQTPMPLPPDDDLMAYTGESQEDKIVDGLDRQGADNANTSHRANIISASQTTDLCAPVSASKARSFAGGLMEHIRATRTTKRLIQPTQ